MYLNVCFNYNVSIFVLVQTLGEIDLIRWRRSFKHYHRGLVKLFVLFLKM